MRRFSVLLLTALVLTVPVHADVISPMELAIETGVLPALLVVLVVVVSIVLLRKKRRK